MDGKASFQESIKNGITFFFLVPLIRRKETIMVAQEEEIDGGPEKKKPGASFSSRDICASG